MFDFALLEVDEIKVPPAVAFRHVKQFVGLFEPVDQVQPQVFSVRGPNKRFTVLVNDIADITSEGINFDDAKALMATVNLEISEVAPVAVPVNPGRFPLVLEPVDTRFEFFVRADIEETQLEPGELVPG